MIKKYIEYIKEDFDTNKKYYHGSYDLLPIGTILKPHDKSYTKINDVQLEEIMEKYKPKDKLSRYDSVFMVDDIDLIDSAGGSIDFIYLVEPLGKIEKSDLNWYTEIDMITPEHNEKLEKKYAENYWNGIPYDDFDSSVFEYRTPLAKIIKLIEEN